MYNCRAVKCLNVYSYLFDKLQFKSLYKMFSLKKELEIAKVICKPPVLVPKTAQKSSLSKIEETKRM